MSTTYFDQPTTPTSRRRDLARRHPVAVYFSLTYVLSWSLWLPYVLGVRGGAGQVLLIVGAFGPMVAAAVVTRWSGGSIRAWLAQIARWRVGPGYYLYALGLPAVLFAVMNLVLALLGQHIDLSPAGERLPAYAATLVFVALLGGGFEEPGWRGFALPRLQRRWSPVVSTLLLGLAWGVWHVPLYGPLGFAVPLVLAFFYTWLYNRTGSVLLCILLHGSFTPALEQLIFTPDSVTVDVVIISTLVAGAVALTVLTRGRLGLAQPGTEPARTHLAG